MNVAKKVGQKLREFSLPDMILWVWIWKFQFFYIFDILEENLAIGFGEFPAISSIIQNDWFTQVFFVEFCDLKLMGFAGQANLPVRHL